MGGSSFSTVLGVHHLLPPSLTFSTHRRRFLARNSIAQRPSSEGSISVKENEAFPGKAEADVVIIGSGIGGLCCGGLLARYGQDVLVLESHDRPGGAAHSFDIRVYTFDSGPSLFSGLQSRGPMVNPLAQVLDALGESLPCAKYDSWMVYMPEGGYQSLRLMSKTCYVQDLEKYGGRNAVPEWRKLLICRALAYIYNCIGICHRDIKPHNLLVNLHTHQLKLCDFGSAKVLVKGELYICSRYYRAPELIFGATEYTTAIDIWSTGCVMAELLLGQPLFPGESGVDQLADIIKVLGTPTREEIKCMNPNYTEFKFPQIKPHPWHKVFQKRLPPEAVDLVCRFFQYSPNLRCTTLEACVHPFFDESMSRGTQTPGFPTAALFLCLISNLRS